MFSETFDTDTANTAATLAQYSAFSYTPVAPSPAVVKSGVLNIGPLGGPLSVSVTQFFDVGGFAGDLTITADLTNTVAGPARNVGISVGNNNMIFHPGLAGGGFPLGSFRVDGPGGFGNQNMGFVPSADADNLNHILITIIEATGQFDITVTDGVTPANVYNASFTNAGYTAGDRIGFTTGGFPDSGIALFDNLVIESTVTPVPEPGTLVLFGLGLLGLGLAKRKPAA